MSPRGVAIPELRRQLFEAAERVLTRDGAARLSGRAITREAGVAAGLLYNHFADLDEFLGEFVVDQFRRVQERAATLPARAGESTVIDNLTAAALSLPGSSALAIPQLVQARPALAAHVGTALAGSALGMQTIERSFADYLEAEKQLGRVAAEADTEALAVAVFGSVHHLWLSPDGLDRKKIRRVVSALLAGATPKPTDRP
jgi:AcrR family transcriptional regulator